MLPLIYFRNAKIKMWNKWFNDIMKTYGTDIEAIKAKPYNLYNKCGVAFKEVDKVVCQMGMQRDVERIRMIIKN